MQMPFLIFVTTVPEIPCFFFLSRHFDDKATSFCARVPTNCPVHTHDGSFPTRTSLRVHRCPQQPKSKAKRGATIATSLPFIELIASPSA